MGSVWIATHHGLQSEVAIKFMAPHVADDPVSVARFKLEARAAAEIRSPHVVQTFDHGLSDSGQPYIVMELLEGESLGQRCKRDGPVPMPLLLAIITQTAKALARAHERGIYHRDIKPENIFLVDGGDETYVKVLDFGVAKFVGAEAMTMTTTGNMVGTPAYMSPEQLFGTGERDHRCDLWALAVVAYYALVGERPFDGVTIGELCAAIRRCDFVAPSQRRNELPPSVDEWFKQAFAKDIGQRFISAKLLAESFERALGAATVMASAPSGVHPRPPVGGASLPGTALNHVDGRASPRLTQFVASLALACVVFGGVVAFFARSNSPTVTSGAAMSSVLTSTSPPPSADEPAVPEEDSVAVVPAATSSAIPTGTPSSRLSAVPPFVSHPPPGTGRRGAQGPSFTSRPATSSAIPSARPTTPRPAGASGDDRVRRAAEELGI
jgi:serine/threonine protein kinase